MSRKNVTVSDLKKCYQHIKDLGKGGDASVALYQHFSNGSLVAVKKALDSTSFKDFQDEVEKLKMLKACDNIVKILGSSIDDASIPATIILEYCHYGSMIDYPEELYRSHSFIPEQTMWKLFADIAKALNFLHTRTRRRAVIVHCDVKPDNILVCRPEGYERRDDTVPVLPKFKLADFTRAVFFHGNTAELEAVEGTPEYFAPEWRDGAKPPIDIWSLGATLQTIITGRWATFTTSPFQREYIRRRGKSFEVPEDPHKFWRYKIPGKFRPINLRTKQQVEMLGTAPDETYHRYSDTLNNWYEKCMQVEVWRRITAKELVDLMVPVAEREMARGSEEDG